MNFEGKLVGTNLKVAIVVSRFNDFITNRLLDGAKDTLVTVSYTHLTLPTTLSTCRYRWWPYH